MYVENILNLWLWLWQYLGYLDLCLLSKHSPERRRTVFSLSQPGKTNTRVKWYGPNYIMYKIIYKSPCDVYNLKEKWYWCLKTEAGIGCGGCLAFKHLLESNTHKVKKICLYSVGGHPHNWSKLSTSCLSAITALSGRIQDANWQVFSQASVRQATDDVKKSAASHQGKTAL